MARLDGLVISGGADVDPARYDADPHPRTANWRPDRDVWELALLTAADAVGLPVLGVCRGMQVMAVHAGGRLDQHPPDLVGHDEHSPGGDVFGEVAVRTEAGSRLAALVGPASRCTATTTSRCATHPGFVGVARADDGTLEAMEPGGGRFCVAVQWHPETAADAGLFPAWSGRGGPSPVRMRRRRDPVLISAHRLGAGSAPGEHSSALERSLALGVDYLEFDVQRCNDGTFVVAHDSRVKVADHLLPVSALTPAQLEVLSGSRGPLRRGARPGRRTGQRRHRPEVHLPRRHVRRPARDLRGGRRTPGARSPGAPATSW